LSAARRVGRIVLARAVLALIVVSALALSPVRVSHGAAPGERLDLDALAEGLAERLGESTVRLPDGSTLRVVAAAEADASAASPGALLDPKRLRTCLETVGKADSWPAAWLVVQEQGRDFDLVMRVALDAAGAVERPAFLFAVPRREWQPGDVRAVALEATGRKPPRKGLGNLVVQGFSTKVVTTYVYEAAPAGASARGLAALLPAGSMIRESKAVELEPGRRYTLALVLADAVFVPSDCVDCASTVIGHADTGRVRLLLCDESEIVAEIDLTDALGGDGGELRLPRYVCEPSDAVDRPPIEAFRDREPVRLLALVDLDGDGRALELELPVEPPNCDRRPTVAVGIDADASPPRLRLLGAGRDPAATPDG